jgi:hypothetical protein
VLSVPDHLEKHPANHPETEVMHWYLQTHVKKG